MSFLVYNDIKLDAITIPFIFSRNILSVYLFRVAVPKL